MVLPQDSGQCATLGDALRGCPPKWSLENSMHKAQPHRMTYTCHYDTIEGAQIV